MTDDFKKGLAVGLQFNLTVKDGEKGNPPDIFNHGDVVGLNPMYFATTSKSQGPITWSVTSSKIYSTMMLYNETFLICAPLRKGKYNYLCFDCAVTQGNSDAKNYYNYTTVGYRLASRGGLTGYIDLGDKKIYLTDHRSQTNYDQTEPWYTLKRQIVKVDLSSLSADEYFFVTMFKCDCTPEIYAIWLE